MKTELGASQPIVQPATEKIGLIEKLSYGCGDFASNIIYGAIGSFLVFFYTDVAKVDAAAIGTILVVSRVLDGLIDILMGVIVDRTKSKYGKARPWLLRMSIPFAISAVLLFTVPEMGSTAKLIYIFVTYNIVNIVYTAINIPYGVLGSLITQDQYQRSVLNIFRMIFAASANLLINIVTVPFVIAMGGGPRGWQMAFAVFGAIAAILFLINFYNTKERVEAACAKKQEDVPFKEGVSALLNNKYWIMVTLYSVANGVAFGLTMGMNIYYAQYFLGDPSLVGMLMGAFMVPMLISLFVLAPFVKKFGKRNVALSALIMQAIGYLIPAIDPYNMQIILAASVIKGISTGPLMAVTFALIADTVEYGEYKSGNRTEGLIFSAQSFGSKCGAGLGGAIIGWVLAFGGYVGAAPVQSAFALAAIKSLFIYIPVVFIVIQILALIPYKLDKEYPAILAELKKRKAAC